MIPRLIHQMWKDASVPPHFRDWQASWQSHHPGWDYRFWTDASLDALVAQDYPALLPLFRGYAEGIRRADLGRVLLLHRFGGLYADLDAECRAPFDALLTERRPILAEEPQAHRDSLLVRSRRLRRLLCNAVMLSPPGHAFWPQVLAAMQRNAAAPSVLDATGPFLLSGVAEDLADGELRLLPPASFYPLARDGQGETTAALAVHHWAGTWIAAPDDAPPSARARRRAWRRRLCHRLTAPRPWMAPPILPNELPAGERLTVLRTPREAPARQAARRNALIAGGLGTADWVLWLDEGLPLDDGLLAGLLAARAPLVGANPVAGPGGESLDEGSYVVDWQPSPPLFWKFVHDGCYRPPRGLGRTYLSALRYRRRQPVDSLGGRCLLVAAELHREGLLFPTRPYDFALDAEGLTAQARDHGLEAVGLPNLELAVQR